jgi:hypothetical protein
MAQAHTEYDPHSFCVGTYHSTPDSGLTVVLARLDSKRVRIRFIETRAEITVRMAKLSKGEVKDLTPNRKQTRKGLNPPVKASVGAVA